MALRDTVSSTAGSFATLVRRFALTLVVLAAVGAMLVGKADTVIVERVRAAAMDLVTPVLDAAAEPVAAVNDFVAQLRDVTNLRTENARLREENARLLEWQSVARRLEAENIELRALSNFKDGPRARFVTARVVGDSGSAFMRSLLLNIGRRGGAMPGQAVVTADGLIGRIVEAGEVSSRILLVTDINFKLPVMIERTRERAILQGDNSPRPRLARFQAVGGIQSGDRIVTSGDGGSFPPGLAVGAVASVGDGGIRVTPVADGTRLELVRIVDYGVTGLVTNPPPPPPPTHPVRGR